MELKKFLNSLNKDSCNDIDDPGIEESIQYIEWLMTWYCNKPSLLIANIIVSRLEALRQLERNGDRADPEWACQRLLRNWKYFASHQRPRFER